MLIECIAKTLVRHSRLPFIGRKVHPQITDFVMQQLYLPEKILVV